MKKPAIAYWLLPSGDERDLFRQIIGILCRELDAPKFHPHLTLSVSKAGGKSPQKALRQIKCAPIRLRTRGVAFSSKYTKTLFVRFKPNRSLEKLIALLGQSAETLSGMPRDPHLSLLYKRRISAATERELARTIKLPFREVRFDAIAAVRMTLPVRNRTDVQAWRIIAKKSLRR